MDLLAAVFPECSYEVDGYAKDYSANAAYVV